MESLNENLQREILQYCTFPTWEKIIMSGSDILLSYTTNEFIREIENWNKHLLQEYQYVPIRRQLIDDRRGVIAFIHNTILEQTKIRYKLYEKIVKYYCHTYEEQYMIPSYKTNLLISTCNFIRKMKIILGEINISLSNTPWIHLQLETHFRN